MSVHCRLIRPSRSWESWGISEACGRRWGPKFGTSWRIARKWTWSGWVGSADITYTHQSCFLTVLPVYIRGWKTGICASLLLEVQLCLWCDFLMKSLEGTSTKDFVVIAYDDQCISQRESMLWLLLQADESASNCSERGQMQRGWTQER